MIQRLTITIFLFYAYNFLFSQVGTLGLQVLGGGNLSYAFNSIAKYKNGITDIDRTTVGITINDNGNPAYIGWTLTIEFEDLDGDGFLTGSASTLPFCTVEVSTNLVACVGCTELAPGPAPPFNLALTNAPQILVQGGDGPGGLDDIPPNHIFSTDKILITYYIGTNPCPCGCPGLGNNLLGSPADFYTDDILLTLTME